MSRRTNVSIFGQCKMQTPLHQLCIEQSPREIECLPGEFAVVLEFIWAWEPLNLQKIADQSARTTESSMLSAMISVRISCMLLLQK